MYTLVDRDSLVVNGIAEVGPPVLVPAEADRQNAILISTLASGPGVLVIHDADTLSGRKLGVLALLPAGLFVGRRRRALRGQIAGLLEWREATVAAAEA